MPVSIRDVATAAGVSVGTVSRAFNDYHDIKEETKQTILAVAKQMGYVPNLHAKTLSAKNRQTMAIILSGFMADHGLTDELVIKMLRGACCYAEENNIEFATYILSSEQQEEKTYEQFCSEHSLAGAMCFGIKTTDVYYKCLQSSKTPCVTVDVRVEGENIGYVGTDNAKACYEMTQQVLALGHRRIVYLNGREEAMVCTERLEGVMAALAEHGLTPEANLYTDFRAECAEALVLEYLATHGKLGATAFLCASDLIALGAAKAINRCGYRVGEDFSLTGFDGLHVADLNEPAIATIDQNMEGKGFAAAELLHAIVDGRSLPRCRTIPYRLSLGGSLGEVREKDQQRF